MQSASKLATALAGIALSSASVLAASMPVKAPPIRPSVAPPLAYSWAGFYIGGHVGYGSGDGYAETAHLPTQAAFDASPFNQSQDVKGWLGGLQAGYNMQSGDMVYGFEADFSWSGMKGSSRVGPLPLFSGAPDPGSSQTVDAALDWFSTARLRFGSVVADRTLLYVTGGLALAKHEYTVVTDYVGDAFRYPGTRSGWRSGWTAGGGLEMAYSEGWSIKAEYLYFDLSGTTILASPVAPNPPFQVRTNHDTVGHIVRLGMNYRFGGNGTVVGARY